MSEAIIKVSPEEWDAQYRTGQWDYLKGITAHYGVIDSLVRKYECYTVIDVGCGSGRLAKFVPCAYFGLDISIEALNAGHNDGIAALCCDAANFKRHPDARYDAAVFCESLYYMPDPLEVLARYFGFCKIIFLSIMISDKTAKLIRSIQERFTVMVDFQLVSATGGGWEIMAVKP